MRIWITDKKEAYSVALRGWNGERWGEDMFSDLADDIPVYNPVRDPDADGEAVAAEMTFAEYADTVEWWYDEVSCYNSGLPNCITDGNTPRGYAEEYDLDFDKFDEELLLNYDWPAGEPLPWE